MNNKTTRTILIVLVSLVLLGLTVYLGNKIYQTREENLSTTQPEAVSQACTLEFTIGVDETPECYETCDIDNDDCPEDLECQEVDGEAICVDPDCPEEEDCVCADELECYETCDIDNDECPDDLECQEIDDETICVDPDCPEEEDCVCADEPTPTPTPTNTPTPTPTPVLSCYDICDLSVDLCPEGQVCQSVNNQTICVDPDCPEEEDCVCPGTTVTPTSTTATTTPPTSLPESGSALPTLGVIIGGLILGFLGIFLAF